MTTARGKIRLQIAVPAGLKAELDELAASAGVPTKCPGRGFPRARAVRLTAAGLTCWETHKATHSAINEARDALRK